MATWQGVNINTGAVELPKYNASGNTTEIYIANVGSTLASADTIIGPVIEAGQFVVDVIAAPDDLDSAGSPAITFEVGYTNSGTTVAAAFIATGNTTAQAGGVAHMNVAAGFGASFTSDSTVVATITNAAGTATAGKFRIGIVTTSSP